MQACLLYTRDEDWKASRLLRAALAHNPHDPTIHFDLAFCYHGMRAFDAAIASYTKVMKTALPVIP